MAPLIVVLFSLRKLAYLPAATVSAIALGAAFGSFDLTRRCFSFAFPPHGTPRPHAALVAGGASLTVASALVAIREALFAPARVPPPAVPAGGPLLARLRSAALLSQHVVRTYPYKFRFLNAFFAGVSGGATWAAVDRAYREQGGAATAAPDAEALAKASDGAPAARP